MSENCVSFNALAESAFNTTIFGYSSALLVIALMSVERNDFFIKCKFLSKEYFVKFSLYSNYSYNKMDYQYAILHKNTEFIWLKYCIININNAKTEILNSKNNRLKLELKIG